MPSNIVMVHVGRTGSVILATMISRAPHVFWDAEVFRPDRRQEYFSQWQTDDPSEILRRRIAHRLAEGGDDARYGFEAQLTQIDALGREPETFLEDLAPLGFDRALVLRRRNVLRQVVSGLAGHASSLWHLHRNELRAGEDPRVRRLRIDVERTRHRGVVKPLVEHLDDEQRRHDRAAAIEPALQLVYEDHVLHDPTVAYELACRHVDLQPLPGELMYERTLPMPLTELLENFDEVAHALRGTPYAHMLDD